MADESMVRTLAAQISAIWPQELPLLDRYRGAARVLDVGAGTGEFSSRLAQLWPEATVTGVDVLSSSVELARNRHQALAPRLQFEQGDAFQLQYPEGSFDLVACRHVLQAIPTPELVISELARVLRPGGYAHILTEDYGMLHMMVAALDPDELWRDGPVQYAARTNTDARIGRRTWSLMRQAGFIDLRVDYVIVDDVAYGFDKGMFCATDLATGKRLWKGGRYGFGQVLLLNPQKLLVVLSEQGEVVLLTANPKKLEELGRFPAITGKTWNHPVVVRNECRDARALVLKLDNRTRNCAVQGLSPEGPGRQCRPLLRIRTVGQPDVKPIALGDELEQPNAVFERLEPLQDAGTAGTARVLCRGDARHTALGSCLHGPAPPSTSLRSLRVRAGSTQRRCPLAHQSVGCKVPRGTLAARGRWRLAAPGTIHILDEDGGHEHQALGDLGVDIAQPTAERITEGLAGTLAARRH